MGLHPSPSHRADGDGLPSEATWWTPGGASASQVALAWTKACQTHPVVGTQELHQLKDNLAAATPRLPDEAVRRLDAAPARSN